VSGDELVIQAREKAKSLLARLVEDVAGERDQS